MTATALDAYVADLERVMRSPAMVELTATAQRFAHRFDALAASLDALTAPMRVYVDRLGTRARNVAHVRRRALTLARGHDGLAVDVTRLLGSLLNRGQVGTAALAVAALDGDRDALYAWQDMAVDGDTLALRVLDLVARLDALTRDVEELIADYAAALLPSLLDDLAAGKEPPPAVSVRGSIDRCAP